MTIAESKYPDYCAWCGHGLEVYSRSWTNMVSMWGVYYTANYCTDGTCGVKGCVHQCEPEVDDVDAAERVHREIQRRRMKKVFS